MEVGQKLFTTQQAADMLGISDNHLRTMIKTGQAQPYQKFGKSWAFTEEEIERLRTRKQKPGPNKK